MKPQTHLFLALTTVLILAFTLTARADEIRFKAGEFSFPAYIEMVADRLNLVVNASRFDESPPARVQVSEHDAGPMSRDQAMAQFLSVLDLRGYTFVHTHDLDTYRIVRRRQAKDADIPLITKREELPDTDAMVTFGMRLKHYPTDATSRSLRNFMPPNSRILSFDITNTLLITDGARSIARMLALVDRLDTPQSAADLKKSLSIPPRVEDCAKPEHPRQDIIQLVLFSLVALIIGFLIRGYVIRRIEGGL